jgi:hypothetical protein
MELLIATFIVGVDDSFLPFLQVLKNNLNRSGVRYELLIACSVTQEIDYHDLQPKRVVKTLDYQNEVEAFNYLLADVSTSNVFIIKDPFLASESWSKNYIGFKDSIYNIGLLTIGFTSFINNFTLTHTINTNFDLVDVYTLDNNIYCGIQLYPIETISLLGGLNIDLEIRESLIEYGVRALKMGLINVSNSNLITELKSIPVSLPINPDTIDVSQIPIRPITNIEELAYHDLDNLLYDNNIKGTKFCFEFTATLGFRCSSIKQSDIDAIINFAMRFNLIFEIKSVFLSVEQKLNENVWVLFNSKSNF